MLNHGAVRLIAQQDVRALADNLLGRVAEVSREFRINPQDFRIVRSLLRHIDKHDRAHAVRVQQIKQMPINQ